MTKTETSKALKEAETRIAKYHDGKGALDKPAVAKRPGVSHGPVGVGPTPRKTNR